MRSLPLIIFACVLLLAGCSQEPEPGLPIYQLDQKDSTHEGYRRTTVTSGDKTYVVDYEEYSLELINPEPTHVIGLSEFGGGKICAIEGQKTDGYIAMDEGGEMADYAPFRDIHLPPFNYHKATFQKMQFALSTGPSANKQTTDTALIQDVIKTLETGKPTMTASLFPTDQTNWKKFSKLHLYTDELPGMVFCVGVYMDNGHFYLAENQNAKQWIEASPTITHWLQTP